MPRYLLDSNALRDYLERLSAVHRRAAEERRRGARLGIGTPVLAETLAGLERSSSRVRNQAALSAALPTLTVWPFDRAAAVEYATIHARLLATGRPIQTNDIMIAAIARTLGATVVTKDGDFAAIKGLAVEDWTE